MSRLLFAFLVLVSFLPSTSFAQRIADLVKGQGEQIVYGGSFSAAIRSPDGWDYVPATRRQQENDHVLAIYKPKKLEISQANVYITAIPVELRRPESLDTEISYDRKMSEQDGLVLLKTVKKMVGNGREFGINTWQGRGFVRYAGISPSANGVFLVVGTSQAKSHDSLVLEGVTSILKHYQPMKRTQ